MTYCEWITCPFVTWYGPKTEHSHERFFSSILRIRCHGNVCPLRSNVLTEPLSSNGLFRPWGFLAHSLSRERAKWSVAQQCTVPRCHGNACLPNRCLAMVYSSFQVFWHTLCHWNVLSEALYSNGLLRLSGVMSICLLVNIRVFVAILALRLISVVFFIVWNVSSLNPFQNTSLLCLYTFYCTVLFHFAPFRVSYIYLVQNVVYVGIINSFLAVNAVRILNS
jgi:hypothetical protein